MCKFRHALVSNKPCKNIEKSNVCEKFGCIYQHIIPDSQNGDKLQQIMYVKNLKIKFLANESITASCQSSNFCLIATSLFRLLVVNLTTFKVQKITQFGNPISILKCSNLLTDCVLIGSNQYFYLLLADGSTIGNDVIHPGQITDIEVFLI